MAKDSIKPGEYFEYRQGIGEFPKEGWLGVELDSDPASMSRNGMALALNMRIDSGCWRNRWGLREIVQLPVAYGTVGPGSIEWLGMHHLQYDPPKLWLASYGCLGVGTEPGAFLQWYNPDKVPDTQTVANFISEGDRVPVIAPYSGEMFFGDWAVLHRPTVIEPLTGEQVNIGVRQSYTSQITGIPGFEVTAMQEFDSKLFLALRDPAGAVSKVVYWDGISLSGTDLSTTTTNGVNFCVWRDAKLAMTQAGSTTLKIRDLAGTWSSVTLPNAITNSVKNTMVEFRDKIYIADDRYIYEVSNFDSPTAATVVTLSASRSATAVATLADRLYYLYNDKSGAAPYPVWLGAYEPDAASWNSTFKQLDTDIVSPNFNYSPGAMSMQTYRNKLYVGGSLSTLITHTLVSDPTSTWFEVRTGGVAKQYIASMRVGG